MQKREKNSFLPYTRFVWSKEREKGHWVLHNELDLESIKVTILGKMLWSAPYLHFMQMYEFHGHTNPVFFPWGGGEGGPRTF